MSEWRGWRILWSNFPGPKDFSVAVCYDIQYQKMFFYCTLQTKWPWYDLDVFCFCTDIFMSKFSKSLKMCYNIHIFLLRSTFLFFFFFEIIHLEIGIKSHFCVYCSKVQCLRFKWNLNSYFKFSDCWSWYKMCFL